MDVIVVDTAHGHSRGVLRAVTRSSSSPTPCRWWPATSPPRGRARADRGRRRRGEGRHRPGLDLHHAHRRRRRRAAVHRGAGNAAACREHGVPGDRRWRHAQLRRHCEGARRRRGMRDDRQPARRHRRGAGRGVPLPGPLLQILSRHGSLGAMARGSADRYFQAGHQGQAEARAGRRGGPRRLQGAGRPA